MINTSRKGWKNQDKTVKALETEGWVIGFKSFNHRMNRFKDFFHLFDIVALKGNVLKLISVKSNRGYSREHVKAISSFPSEVVIQKELWDWRDYESDPKIMMF